jgi:MinD superfamily P-loop ATPase
MKIACLSGKGGAGKTFVAVNLAAAAGNCTYIDCDVEEPNGRLFWKPEEVKTSVVNTLLPAFDAEKCTGCKKCVNACRFHALMYIKEKPMVFSEVCHSCGLCQMVCPQGAVAEEEKAVGVLEIGRHGETKVVSGILNLGEASGVPVIRAALKQAEKLTFLDCPPGSACSVMESIMDADYCVLVTEPTAFGFHNFQMVHQLASLLKKPCGVVINKQLSPYEPLERFCEEHHLPVLERIPYNEELARRIAQNEVVAETVPEEKRRFRALLDRIGGAV